MTDEKSDPHNKPSRLTPVEAAEYLRVSKWSLDRWRQSGGGPRFIKVGRKKIFYEIADLDSWLESRKKS